MGGLRIRIGGKDTIPPALTLPCRMGGGYWECVNGKDYRKNQDDEAGDYIDFRGRPHETIGDHVSIVVS